MKFPLFVFYNLCGAIGVSFSPCGCPSEVDFHHFVRFLKPLHPNISIHILHSLRYKFPLVPTRRIRLTIKASLGGDHFLYSHDLKEWFSHNTVRRKSLSGFTPGWREALCELIILPTKKLHNDMVTVESRPLNPGLAGWLCSAHRKIGHSQGLRS